MSMSWDVMANFLELPPPFLTLGSNIIALDEEAQLQDFAVYVL